MKCNLLVRLFGNDWIYLEKKKSKKCNSIIISVFAVILSIKIKKNRYTNVGSKVGTELKQFSPIARILTSEKVKLYIKLLAECKVYYSLYQTLKDLESYFKV